MVMIEIVNVVATASLNQTFDFDELRECKEIFNDSDAYGGRVAYFKTKKLQGKVSIFLSGPLRKLAQAAYASKTALKKAKRK